MKPLFQRESPEKVIHLLRQEFGNRRITVVANREPYLHQWNAGKIEVARPASGLVSALEPVLRECGGIWVAHGSGSADRETCDDQSEIRVPPEDPRYVLKRVWLTPDEVSGFYEGFSNEGLWPLCHMAHERPTFRQDDWETYVKINRRFCQETPDRALEPGSLILVQDYHFALLPQLLQKKIKRRRNPDGTRALIGIFWHIPWPNPEVLAICPWTAEILTGMMGADVIGFHTQQHVSNFLKSCEHYLEARVDWEQFTVTKDQHTTRVHAFPIGIDTSPIKRLQPEEEIELRNSYGIVAEKIGVAVDRIDYTKGLLERMESIERALEKHPDLIGRFTLVQIGAPSRVSIPAYQDLQEKLKAAVDRVNRRFGMPPYQPIILITDHHDWENLQKIYQIGDVCLVTSLHDGMNLVAKEYAWCQRADRGSLILSRFTGASRELTEALMVNPYSIDEVADAIHTALHLPLKEKRDRMLAMKAKIQNRSAFHWAADLIHFLRNTPAFGTTFAQKTSGG